MNINPAANTPSKTAKPQNQQAQAATALTPVMVMMFLITAKDAGVTGNHLWLGLLVAQYVVAVAAIVYCTSRRGACAKR